MPKYKVNLETAVCVPCSRMKFSIREQKMVEEHYWEVTTGSTKMDDSSITFAQWYKKYCGGQMAFSIK